MIVHSANDDSAFIFLQHHSATDYWSWECGIYDVDGRRCVLAAGSCQGQKHQHLNAEREAQRALTAQFQGLQRVGLSTRAKILQQRDATDDLIATLQRG